MKNKSFESIVCNIFSVLAAIVFFILFVYSLFLTGVNTNPLNDEIVTLESTSVFVNIIELAIMLAVFFFISKVCKYINTLKRRNVLLYIICIISAVISIYWFFSSGVVPGWDQRDIVDYAVDFNKGNYEGLLKGEYVALCPQQLGLISVLRILFILFGEGNFLVFQFFNALTVPVTIYAGCRIVRIISNDNAKAELFYLLLMVSCFPMYVYIPYVYGDLCSVAFVMLSAWGMLSCFSAFSFKKVVFTGISMGFAIVLRTNVYICLFAFIIVGFVKLIQTKDKNMLIILAGLIAGTLLLQIPIKAVYARHTPSDADALPAISYIVMGLNDDYGNCGYWNGYHNKILDLCDYDMDRAKEIYYADFKTLMGVLKSMPAYTLDFFARKMNTQWNTPMYQCVSMNCLVERSQGLFVSSLYNKNRFGLMMENWARQYQHLMYFSILLLLAFRGGQRKTANNSAATYENRATDISFYILLIGVFGGFLFSLLWEQKTRYVFPYLLMMIPYMGIGLSEITGRVNILIDIARKRAAR